MAITSTTLSADLSATANKMTVTSGTDFPTSGGTTPQNYLVQIDDEYMYAVLQPVAGTITLRGRGSYGTRVVAHDNLSRVRVSSDPQDFTAIPTGGDVPGPPYRPDRVTLGEDRTFTTAEIKALTRDTIFQITKATACLFTLVAPNAAQDGIQLTFISQTAAAHVMTATALIADGAAGSPEDTATWDAFIGATLTVRVQNGLFAVTSAVGVVIT